MQPTRRREEGPPGLSRAVSEGKSQAGRRRKCPAYRGAEKKSERLPVSTLPAWTGTASSMAAHGKKEANQSQLRKVGAVGHHLHEARSQGEKAEAK